MLKRPMWLCAVCLCLLVVFAGPNVWAHSFSQTELAYMPATKQLELFKTGVIAPIDVLEAQIARVEQYNGPIKKDSRDLLPDYKTWNGKVNAICFERFADARKAALESGKRWKHGTARTLEGITVGIKNENEVKGWRVDQGSLLLKNTEPETFDGAITKKLKDAGAILAFSLLNTYPVVNVPVALSSTNVPIGVQVVGNTYDDLEEFRVAAQLSKVMPELYTGKLMPDFRNMK